MIDILKERPPIHGKTIVFAVIIALILFSLIMYNETPLTKGKSTFYLPSSSPADIKEALEENGYELNAFDRIAMMFIKLPRKGWYRIDGDEVGRFSFWKNLHKKQAKSIYITVFAGETSSEILHRLSREMKLDIEKLEQYYKDFARFKNGNILAGKYLLARSSNEEEAVRHLLDNSYTEMDLFAREEFGGDFNETQLRETLIIASIIQKETNDIEEMFSVSSVIQNRLKKGMKLQMDGTLNYGKYIHTIVTPERIRTDKSRYNTYKCKGLVPDPLCSVSMEALQAAASPQESDYLFFVLNKKGKHVFAETYKKHLKNVKEFKAYLRQRDKIKKVKEKKKVEEKKKKASKQKIKKEEEAKKSVQKPVKTIEKKVIDKKTVSTKAAAKETNRSKTSRIQMLFSDINATIE